MWKWLLARKFLHVSLHILISSEVFPSSFLSFPRLLLVFNSSLIKAVIKKIPGLHILREHKRTFSYSFSLSDTLFQGRRGGGVLIAFLYDMKVCLDS